jgi:GNAT superfamily N-acetyltransferase
MAGVQSYPQKPPASNLVELEQLAGTWNPDEIVIVAEEGGDVAGFFGLVLEDEWVELLRFFLTVDRIGAGYGRELWEQALATANELREHRSKIRIISDPGAIGFYERFGCALERRIVIDDASGFALGLMWYDLDR